MRMRELQPRLDTILSGPRPGRLARSAIAFLLLSSFLATSAPAADEASTAPGSQRHYLELSRAEHNAKLAWRPLRTFAFDDPAMPDGFRIKEGTWEIRDGQLEAVAGKADEYRTILIAPCPAGPMRVEFDCTWFARPDGRVGDIYLRFNADSETGSSAKGYGLFVGHYFNQASVCYKLNQPIARTEWSPIVPGRRHHLVAEWTPRHLRLWMDDRIVMDAWDRDKPIAPDPAAWIGLAVYDTRVAIDNLTVSTPAVPDEAPLSRPAR